MYVLNIISLKKELYLIDIACDNKHSQANISFILLRPELKS